ncbi:MAG: ATP-binding protein, partial [Firmicutes bacterium]|nr:ATP-binding protein [Bacillota bacterium]
FDVDGESFSNAGRASVETKKLLRQLGVAPDIIRSISVAMYEGEINMVIHAHGGDADVYITEDTIRIVLKDVGPGIKNVEEAMKEGFSTAPESIRALGFGAGMGLPNMKRYSDEMHIETEVGVGTTIEMMYHLNK